MATTNGTEQPPHSSATRRPQRSMTSSTSSAGPSEKRSATIRQTHGTSPHNPQPMSSPPVHSDRGVGVPRLRENLGGGRRTGVQRASGYASPERGSVLFPEDFWGGGVPPALRSEERRVGRRGGRGGRGGGGRKREETLWGHGG